MTSTNELEIKGNLREHALAELLVEIAQAKLNGSLRVAGAAQKIVIYTDAGDVVFAVSNARASRLFEAVLASGKIGKQQLLAIADFTNDLALRENLLKNNLFSKPELDALFVRQIEEILRSAFAWREGEWTFSPLVRIKADIRFSIDSQQFLIEYARDLTDKEIAGKFENADEVFRAKPAMPVHINLLPEEAFVFSRFETAALSPAQINAISGLPEGKTQRIIYALWLGGFVERKDWNAAFGERRTAAILSANFSLKKEEKPPPKAAALPKVEQKAAASEEAEKTVEEVKPKEISLEEYLERTENAGNFYESLNVAQDADVAAIKQSYFALAKRFHPDLFHKTADREQHLRISDAFSQIAQAYETLKTKSSRDVYDYRMRKELMEAKKRGVGAAKKPSGDEREKQAELALENFEQGFGLLMNEDYEAAIPFLARAAHFAEKNARYHAYYGKALSADRNQRHKAEAELQTAVRLDATNADWRIMLAEFFAQVGLVKRAEGELNRLLAIFPSNVEARRMLDSLSQK